MTAATTTAPSTQQDGHAINAVADALVAALAVAAVWALPTRVYNALVTEDGPIEWLQVAALVVVLASLVRTAARWTVAPAWMRLALLALAGMTFVVIGEEIAWGTRLFDIGVDAVQSRNAQGEVTLHNLGGGLEKSFLGIALVGVACAVAVVRRAPGLAVWFLGPAVYAVVRAVHLVPVDYRFAKLSEVLELVLYVALARLAVEARRRVLEGRFRVRYSPLPGE